MLSLIDKYNYEVPRYTSYPVITQWNDALSGGKWADLVSREFQKSSALSLYIHLPFCESLCTYCGCNKHITTNHDVEDPYINAVLKEWQMYSSLMQEKSMVQELHLGGGTPTFFSPEHLKKLITGLFEAGIVISDQPAFSFEAHPSSTTEEHLVSLQQLGFNRISIGVQTFNDHILTLIHRFQTKEQVYQTVALARKHGYSSVNFDLIYGLPQQDLTDIEQTMDHVASLMPERIAFYSYAHVPWTKPSQRAYNEADLPTGEEKRALYERGKERLLALGYEEIGMDHFALPGDGLAQARHSGRLNRNFMGYTDLASDRMIGLGVSSISELAEGYHQNVKTLKEYYAAIEAVVLPGFRSHLLDEGEQQTRYHVKNLMCRLETSASIDAVADPDALTEMMNDGLLMQTGNTYQITPAGLPFIRNIAACFDPAYQRKKEVRQFSSAI